MTREPDLLFALRHACRARAKKMDNARRWLRRLMERVLPADNLGGNGWRLNWWPVLGLLSAVLAWVVFVALILGAFHLLEGWLCPLS